MRYILAIVLFLFYAPVVVLMINSFNASRFGGKWEGFSMKWYELLWKSDSLWTALFHSLKIATIASLGSVILGSLAAFALHRYQSQLQRLHHGLLILPLVMPDVLMGISLLLLFVAVGMETGFLTIWIAHITFCISFVTMVISARLQDFDHTLIEAARDLGANSWQAAWRVLIPLLAPGLISGGLLAFTLSIDDYVITFFVQGAGTSTLPLHIYSMIKVSRNMPVINALSTILLLVTFVIVTFSYWLTKPTTPTHHSSS